MTIASSENSLEVIKFFINSGRASSSVMLNRFLKSRMYKSTSSAICLGSVILAILASNSTWFVSSHLPISSLTVSFSLSIASSSYLFAAAVSLSCNLCAPLGARLSFIFIVPPGNSNSLANRTRTSPASTPLPTSSSIGSTISPNALKAS